MEPERKKGICYKIKSRDGRSGLVTSFEMLHRQLEEEEKFRGDRSEKRVESSKSSSSSAIRETSPNIF